MNAAKYSTSFLTHSTSFAYHAVDRLVQPVLSSGLHSLKIISKIISTLFTLTWDLKMDWGVFAANAGDHRFLREEIIYSSTWFYYFAIAEDVVLRFSWALAEVVIKVGIMGTQ